MQFKKLSNVYNLFEIKCKVRHVGNSEEILFFVEKLHQDSVSLNHRLHLQLENIFSVKREAVRQ